jgi:amino acid adenylation domain-containing protein/non-ribosomal peptide synthase protein (TIGR01720 family)
MHIEEIEDIYPALLLQQELLGEDSTPGKTYNAVGCLRLMLKGALDADAFAEAWRLAVAKHPLLRTSFAWKLVGKPLRLVHKQAEAALSKHDWRRLSPTRQQERRELLSERDAEFDPARLPLVRLSLNRLGEDAYEFIARYHHLVLDGRSMRLLFKEVMNSYAELSEGRAVRLTREHSRMEEPARHGHEELEEAKQFWRELLRDYSGASPLRVEKRGPSMTASRPAHQNFSHGLPPHLAGALKTFAAGRQIPANFVVEAAWAILLSRYSGESDIIFGAAVSPAPGDVQGNDSLLGPLTNVLPVRIQVQGNATFDEWLKGLETRRTAIARHGAIPLNIIADWSGPGRERVLFETLVICEEELLEEAPGQGRLEVREVPQSPGHLYPYVLTAVLSSSPTLEITYDSRRFEAETIERMAGHMQVLIEAALADPSQSVDALPMLTASEQRQVLVEWNRTQTAYPHESCFHHLFEQRVRRSPDAVAVECGDERLTYDELNRRANQLGRYLRRLGGGPEMLVAIFLERSVEMMVALLGVMKAGGAYLPLDFAYPLERLSFILEDAQAPFLLTQERLSGQMPSYWGQMLCLDELWDDIARENEEPMTGGSLPENLVYVIYTSGSTGKPKGTLIQHRGLVNYLHWCTQRYPLTQGCGAPVHSPLSFDLTITGLFAPLLAGEKVVLLPEGGGVGPLSDELNRRARYSLVKLTPAHLDALAEQLSSADLAEASRALVIGGDVLTAEKLSLWRRHAPDTVLFNEYGPTETVVGCCVYEVPLGLHESGPIPIGRPINNTQLYILDERSSPVPIGLVGELHIGGDGLARGYHRRPGVTAEKFVPHPFSAEPGARLYRTGDLARYLPGGEIEFLGRADEQLKVRGFRVEPGEIEAALCEHRCVRESAVVARQEVPGNKRLVAYFVSEVEPTPAADELRRFLSLKLPDYMVPSEFVALDEMPLTPNGKVDRRALAAGDVSQTQSPDTLIAPSNSTEKLHVEIWRQVLNLPEVSVSANFFELGGDSILGVKLISRLNQAGLRLTPEQLFQYPTIAQLAAITGVEAPAAGYEQMEATGPVPLTPIQHWFFEQEFPDEHHWNISVLLDARRPLVPSHLEAVVKRLVSHHDALRLRFTRGESGPQQFYAEGEDASPFELFDLSSLTEAARQQDALRATTERLQAGLSLSEGPLMRVALFDLGRDKPSRCLLVLHHLVADAVSLRVLLEDLQTGYEQVSSGREIEFPPTTTSFKSWAEELQTYADSEALRQEAAHWSLSRGEVSPLPVDYPGGNNLGATAETVSVSLGAEETRSLLQEVPNAYRTRVNDVLLTALARSLATWVGSDTLLVDLEGHGRERLIQEVDLARTVGWFTTIYPVVFDLRETHGSLDVLRKIKEQMRAVPKHGSGYGLLRYLRSKDEIGSGLCNAPQAEIVFNYLGQFDQTLSAVAPFRLSSEPVASQRSPRAPRPYLLEVIGHISGERLHVDWHYSRSLHRRETIERLADAFKETLHAIITHCPSPTAVAYTPSDFPGAKLSQTELDQFIARISQAEARRADGNTKD